MDLVVDHSVQVDVARSENALQLNMEHEFNRNKERFAFLKWGSSAFNNMLVVPPGSGIVHQVGHLKSGLNPLTAESFVFEGKYLKTLLKTGLIIGIVTLIKVDKIDFLVCMGAYVGVVFGNIEIGLIIVVTISLLRLILHVSRPHTVVLGNIPNTTVFRNAEQYPDAARVLGILILRIDAPIYFSNSSYLRERIMRWIMDEEEHLAKLKEDTLQYVIIDMGPVTTIDTSGIKMLEELKRTIELKGLQLALSNPGSDLMEKLQKEKFTEILGPNWLFLTVGEGVAVCSSLLQARKLNR